MPFSDPFRYYSIFVLLFVTIRRFGGPAKSMQRKSGRFNVIFTIVYSRIHIKFINQDC